MVISCLKRREMRMTLRLIRNKMVWIQTWRGLGERENENEDGAWRWWWWSEKVEDEGVDDMHRKMRNRQNKGGDSVNEDELNVENVVKRRMIIKQKVEEWWKRRRGEDEGEGELKRRMGMRWSEDQTGKRWRWSGWGTVEVRGGG